MVAIGRSRKSLQWGHESTKTLYIIQASARNYTLDELAQVATRELVGDGLWWHRLDSWCAGEIDHLDSGVSGVQAVDEFGGAARVSVDGDQLGLDRGCGGDRIGERGDRGDGESALQDCHDQRRERGRVGSEDQEMRDARHRGIVPAGARDSL